MTADNFQPYGDRILIEIIAAPTETAGGIVLPDAAQEKPVRGTVVKVGPGGRHETTGERLPIMLTEGDVVLFSKYGGVDVDLEGDFLLIREADVLGIEGEVAF